MILATFLISLADIIVAYIWLSHKIKVLDKRTWYLKKEIEFLKQENEELKNNKIKFLRKAN